MHYQYDYGGVAALNVPMIVQFSMPYQGLPSGAITLTMPALGAGNTNASCNLHGYLR
jgi:hypothetical protein